MRLMPVVLALLVGASARGQVRVLPIPAHAVHGQLVPEAISGDGRVIVGHGATDSAGLVWTIDGDMEVVPAGYTVCPAHGVNGDGTVVVGTTRPNSPVGYRWVRGGALTLLTARGAGPAVYSAGGVTDDGRMVVGQGRISNAWAGVRWRDAASASIPGPPGYPSVLFMNACSADGFSAVGVLSGSLAFLWRATGESILIPTLPGLTHADSAVITSTGELILAKAFDLPGTLMGYTWTPDTGAYVLPRINGVQTAYDALTDDGRLIVGSCGGRAAAWTPGGVQYLSEYINQAGGAFAPEDFGFAQYLSRGGEVIVGKTGIFPYWVVIMSPARPADFNLDRFVDFFDLEDYLDCWEGRTRMPLSTADLNRDGFTDFFDVLEFLDRFDGGG